MWCKLVKVAAYERGLVFRDGALARLLAPGWHWLWEPSGAVRFEKVSVREPWVRHRDLEVIARSAALADEALILDLKDHERALVWIDGRLAAVCAPGLYVLWTAFHEVHVERIDARPIRFEHAQLALVLAADGKDLLESLVVPAGWAGLVFQDGRHAATLAAGTYAFWRRLAQVKFQLVDLREQSVDVPGQEIMTADRVTLRLNAVVSFRVVDPVKALLEVDGYDKALYRHAQLALRAAIGTRELDVLLAEKDALAETLAVALRQGVAAFGLELRAFGIRDVILPGEMKELLNRVTAARKVAEAALITRREETAAIRSQANTARIFESNATLMRLRELEVLEKVAGTAKLSVVLGDGGLTDRVVKLL